MTAAYRHGSTRVCAKGAFVAVVVVAPARRGLAARAEGQGRVERDAGHRRDATAQISRRNVVPIACNWMSGTYTYTLRSLHASASGQRIHRMGEIVAEKGKKNNGNEGLPERWNFYTERPYQGRHPGCRC